MKKTLQLIIAFALVFAGTAQFGYAQLSLDMESGDREADAANCWEFNGTGYTDKFSINGKLCGMTEELVDGFKNNKGIVSPWILCGNGQTISFIHRLSDNSFSEKEWKACYVVSQKVEDKGTNNFDTLYYYEYNNKDAQNNVSVNFSIPFSHNGQVRKIYFLFAGEGSNQRGIIDDITIDSKYFSDPSSKCEPVSTITDTDKDGVADEYDAYPNDEYKAYAFSFPEAGGGEAFGALMFEDLWPSRGDYDFNDLVINYRVTLAMNADGNLTDITFKLVTRAWGAGYRNGFALQFNDLPTDRIKSITGQKNFGDSPFKLNDNGTEAGNSSACVVFISDVTQALKRPSGGQTGVNVYPDGPHVPYDTTEVLVTFMEKGEPAKGGPTTMKEFEGDIMNPFLIINQDRTREIHLPGQKPTEMVDFQLFGTGDDNSNPAEGRYYVTKNNHPWAISSDWGSIPYMIEKIDITTGFLKLIPWVMSNQTEFQDWYKDEKGFRDNEKLYLK